MFIDNKYYKKHLPNNIYTPHMTESARLTRYIELSKNTIQKEHY